MSPCASQYFFWGGEINGHLKIFFLFRDMFCDIIKINAALQISHWFDQACSSPPLRSAADQTTLAALRRGVHAEPACHQHVTQPAV